MTFAIDKYIATCESWGAFTEKARSLPISARAGEPDRGKVFERLTELYLRTSPEYGSKLAQVWPLRDTPERTRSELGLPRLDEGIDLVALTKDDRYWAIQCKFRTDFAKALTVRELSTFANLAFNVCHGFSFALVSHTCTRRIRKNELLPRTAEIGLDRWLGLEREEWDRIRAAADHRPPPPIESRRPRPHQQKAIQAAQEHFQARGASRGRLIMPCGTGKSLTAFWIVNSLNAKNILVAVPSLGLIRQSLTDWTRESLAVGNECDWLCVCGDETTARLDQDEFTRETFDLGVEAVTDPSEIARFLMAERGNQKIVFATYQSGRALAQAASISEFKFDIGVFDEAHKTVGQPGKLFSHMLADRNVRIARRLFMTATERVAREIDVPVLSMDDESIYGQRFFQLSFKEAIEANPPIISDYKVVTIAVADERTQDLIRQKRQLKLPDETWCRVPRSSGNVIPRLFAA